MKKKFLAMLLVVCLIASMVPAALATEEVAASLPAASDGVIKLNSNVTLGSSVEITTNTVIDLNGYNITGEDVRVFHVKSGTLTLSGEGTVTSVKAENGALAETSSVIRVGDGSSWSSVGDTSTDAGLVVGEAVTIKAPDTYGVSAFGSDTSETVTVYGTILAENAPALSGNGYDDTSTTTMVIKADAKLESENGVAIYQPNNGILNVEGGYIKGVTGIEAKAGEVNISGNPTIKATGNQEYKKTVNGSSTSGYAVVAVNDDTWSGTVSANITGGTFSGAVAAVGNDDSGGASAATVKISGGTFDTDVSAYLESGVELIADAETGDYVVANANMAGELVAEYTSYVESDAVKKTVPGSDMKYQEALLETISAGYSALWAAFGNSGYSAMKTEVANQKSVFLTALKAYVQHLLDTVYANGQGYTPDIDGDGEVSEGELTYSLPASNYETACDAINNATELAEVITAYETALESQTADDDDDEDDDAVVEYTVTFDYNYSSKGAYTTVIVETGETVDAPTNPTRSNYSFKGWYTQSSGGDEFDFDTAITGNITLYAKWSASSSGSSSSGSSSSGSSSSTTYYTLTFDTNGGSSISSVSKAEDTTVDLTDYETTRDGYVFDGWYADNDLTDEIDSVTLTENTTVYAAWTEEEPEDELPYTDVDVTDYFYNGVVWALEQDVTSGTTATTFSPDMSCTRAQMVTFLWRAVGSPAPTSYANPFTDVDVDGYYGEAVLWAVENGITAGTSDTTFSPDATVTRAQAVTFLYRHDGAEPDDYAAYFLDVESGAYYDDAVMWAVDNGITEGTGDGMFSPDADCTRSQIVTFLYRYFG